MEENNELKHYGVLGMKWGVHRATKQYHKAVSKGDNKKASKAISKLDKHRGKITKKLTALDKEGKKLEKQNFDVVTKSDVKAAKLQTEINRLHRKAGGFLTSENRAMRLTEKANKLTIRLNEIKAYSNEVKAKVEQNKAMKETFSKTLSDVNNAIEKGRKYLEGDEPTKKTKSINQKTYDRFLADDVEGVVKNMSKKQRDDVYKNVSRNADWPEIEDYIARKYNK